jgi:LPXTG-motif cell wall-anchored protein
MLPSTGEAPPELTFAVLVLACAAIAFGLSLSRRKT